MFITQNELIKEIEGLDWKLRDILAGPQMDISMINQINNSFQK